MGTYRFNVIDDNGTVSFLGPRHGSKMIAAACGADHRTLRSLLTYIKALDEVWASEIEAGLEAFDAGIGNGQAEVASGEDDGAWRRPFRVVDPETRRRSMTISSLGLFVVNLKERRIVQIDNRSHELEKSGKGRVRRNGRPTRMLFHYDLPAEWALVP